MTIKEVVDRFQLEQQEAVTSRFPCRAIMMRNIRQYCDLLSELKKIGDICVVQSLELFSSADVMPNYEILKADKYRNKWIILTGVSEYLRLFSKREALDRRFANLWSYQAPASSTGRIIIPLWGCEAQWFDKSIGLNHDLRQEDFFYDCTDQDTMDQAMNVLVLSGVFEKYISKLETVNGNLRIGLQDWFDYWTDPSPENESFVLLTKRCSSISPTNGNVSIRIMTDILAFIRENMFGAEILTSSNCTDEMQQILFEHALAGHSLDDALLSILNMSTFSGVDIMGKWNTLPNSHRRFTALWLSIHPDGTYLSHCFAVSKDISRIADSILMEIFDFWLNKAEWIAEYKQLITVMALIPDTRFFTLLDSVPTYETRLDLMNGSSRNERIYLLRMVGKWVRSDFLQVESSVRLKEVYPELAAYLNLTNTDSNDELNSYMFRYKSYKLENTLPPDEDSFFCGTHPDVYDSRYSVLSEYIDSDTVVIWIDALGIEWLPLLQWSISQNCDCTVKANRIAQACLPTETCFNDHWKDMDVPYEKLDRLDKLAHKGVIDEPDYYACIEDQLSFVTNVSRRVSELLLNHHRVIVTGDHGTSRLAARFFHVREGVSAPKNATVFSHGRYCELAQSTSYIMPNVHIEKHSDGTQYAVFANYDHFKQSGFAAGADDENAVYGEVHGGATPEEMLVPVLVMDSKKEIQLTADWVNSTAKIAMKKVKLTLSFNKPIHQLNVKTSQIIGDASSTTATKTQWNIVFSGIKPGTYMIHVLADNRLVEVPDITVIAALAGEGDLP